MCLNAYVAAGIMNQRGVCPVKTLTDICLTLVSEARSLMCHVRPVWNSQAGRNLMMLRSWGAQTARNKPI